MANHKAKNPSITGNCEGMTVGKSYCVEATFEPTPTASPTGPSGPTGTPGSKFLKLIPEMGGC